MKATMQVSSPMNQAARTNVSEAARLAVINEARQRLDLYAYVSTEFEASRLEEWADVQHPRLLGLHDQRDYEKSQMITRLIACARRAAADLRTGLIKQNAARV